MLRRTIQFGLSMLLALIVAFSTLLSADDTALSKALQYLTVEVPAWKKDNGCFSCHNNGDAARALMVARREAPIADTLTWLRKPSEWDKQQSDAPFRDKGLARVQFSFALAEAVNSGLLPRDAYFIEAAEQLAVMQAPGGSWPLDQDAAVGSPATYGTPLATYAALRTLLIAGSERFEKHITRGREWLRALKPSSIPDAAAVALALRDANAVKWLLAAQNRDGGWGPYRTTPSEAFDTAIASLALFEAAQPVPAARGIEWLRKTQLKDGGWEGTTRPSGGGSYAQHISTSGWATLALLKAR
jgi:hypothetical protein